MSINISYSLLADYLSCQRKPMYRLQFPELAVSNKEMVVGSAVHAALEKYSTSFDSAMTYMISYLDLHHLDSAENTAYAIDCLSIFFDAFRRHLTEKDDIEIKFKLPLVGQSTFLVGKIDRISNGKVFDWKTTRNPPKKLFNDLQFIIYEWAYKQLYGEYPIASYYGALATGTLVQHFKTGDAEKYVFDEIIPQVIFSIKNNMYPRTGFFTRACYRCPYKETCLKEHKENVVDSGAFTSE